MKNINNKQLLAFGALTVASVTGAFGACSVYADETPAQRAGFEDEALYSCVLTAAGAEANTILTAEQLATITNLECINKGVSSIVGIDKMTSLRDLNLNDNNLKTYESASGNAALYSLSLARNNLESANFSKLTNLKVLVLDDNKMTQLDVTNNTNLEQLSVGHNKLTELHLETNEKLTGFSAKQNISISIFTPRNNRLVSIEVDSDATLFTGIKATKTNISTTTGTYNYVYDLSPFMFLNPDHIQFEDDGNYMVSSAESKLYAKEVNDAFLEVIQPLNNVQYFLKIADIYGVMYYSEGKLAQPTEMLDYCLDPIGALSCTAKITIDNPTRDGYTFLGWSRKEGATVADFKRGDSVKMTASQDEEVATGNYACNLYAVWRKGTAGQTENPNTGDSSLSTLVTSLILGLAAGAGLFLIKRRR